MVKRITLLFLLCSFGCVRSPNDSSRPSVVEGCPCCAESAGSAYNDSARLVDPMFQKEDFSSNQFEDASLVSENAHPRASKPDFLKGSALLLTKFKSMEDLKKVVSIEYLEIVPKSDYTLSRTSAVRLSHEAEGNKVTSILMDGIDETDITRARDGGLWDRIKLGLNAPYLVLNKAEMQKIYILSRRRRRTFGAGDFAFYDLAETMLHHISDDDFMELNSEDLSEKGYHNTFNHITAQTFMTAIFSEQLADFVADTHERSNLAELVNGKFSEAQLTDLETGPVDNYVDIINNEWGQELGKFLKNKYNIDHHTFWTPTLLANFLNDVQNYYSWVFQIGFKPFRPEDESMVRFSDKINRVLEDVSGLQ